MTKVYLGLGSNLGEKLQNLKSAIQYFIWDDRFKNVEISPFYLSTPYGNIKQENFINCAISFDSSISADVIFNVTKELEKRIGRKQKGNWGPREIDIDILYYGDHYIKNENMTIPHRDLLNRDFVIVPLLDLDPEIVHPGTKKKLKLFLSQLKDKYIIDRINFNIFEENPPDNTKN